MLSPPKYQNNLATGFLHLSEGIRLIWHPKLRAFIMIPLVVNLALFVVLTSVIFSYFDGAINWIMDFLPSWLAPLAWLTVLVVGMLFLVVYGYSFNLITNIIAAPFYGILAQKTEELLTGQSPPDESLLKMVPRVILRELRKLIYFLTRGCVVLLVMLLIATLPLINLLAPAIGLAWAAWSMAIQYSDYAADNHQKDFKELRFCLWQKKFSSLGFGGFIMLCSVVPVVNIFIMPAAVTGGTSFWLKELAACNTTGCSIE
ncbi:Sulfate transporter CysZ [Thalassocella blandensis]|nr:Sulfate transporter CysZ [Thalassocella blandensis]